MRKEYMKNLSIYYPLNEHQGSQDSIQIECSDIRKFRIFTYAHPCKLSIIIYVKYNRIPYFKH